MYFKYFLRIHQVCTKWTTKIVRWLVYGVEYLKSNKTWYVRVLKCLDHDQMVVAKICMSKVINLSNMLLSVVFFVPT